MWRARLLCCYLPCILHWTLSAFPALPPRRSSQPFWVLGFGGVAAAAGFLLRWEPVARCRAGTQLCCSAAPSGTAALPKAFSPGPAPRVLGWGCRAPRSCGHCIPALEWELQLRRVSPPPPKDWHLLHVVSWVRRCSKPSTSVLTASSASRSLS